MRDSQEYDDSLPERIARAIASVTESELRRMREKFECRIEVPG
jgi:hypothetical protein